MFECKVFNNYATQILHAKYEEVDTNNPAANQKQLNITHHHGLQQVLTKCNKLIVGNLGAYPIKRSTLTYHQAWSQYTFKHTWCLVPMNKRLIRKSNAWLILESFKNVVPLSWNFLPSLFPKDMTKSCKTSDLCSLSKCIKQKKYPLSIIHDTSIPQNFTSPYNIILLNLMKNPMSCV